MFRQPKFPICHCRSLKYPIYKLQATHLHCAGQYTITDYKLEDMGKTSITWNDSISRCLSMLEALSHNTKYTLLFWMPHSENIEINIAQIALSVCEPSNSCTFNTAEIIANPMNFRLNRECVATLLLQLSTNTYHKVYLV